MKKNVLFLGAVFSSVLGFSQIHNVTIEDVQTVSIADLNACTDASSYDGDTVKIVGVAIHDGSLTEVSSSSVTGGCRPGIHLLDTANMGAGGDFRGIQIHGVEGPNLPLSSNPVASLHTLFAGDVVEITGVVGSYQGETQIYPLGDAFVNVLTPIAAPQARVVSVGDLNDGNRVNQLPTGEPIEGSFVMLNNVTVTAVNSFGSGRVSIDVTDVNGNTINVSDRFLAQKTSSHTSVNPQSPSATGSFVAPPVGLVYDTLMGIVLHSENGCTGGGGRGYEINPFDASHYVVGVTPPAITDVIRMPTVPTSSESPVIDCKIIDFDGTVASAYLHYTNDILGASFDSVMMTLKSGSTDEYTATIPAMADGDMVGYFIRAEDNDGNVSQNPAQDVHIYTVRDNGLQIVDIQKVLDYNDDASYYEGDTVTVTGVVASSAKPYDLGFVFLQQPGAAEWGGIRLTGISELVFLSRTEEITVTGVVEENYGFTRLIVSEMTKTGNLIPIEVTYFDPSDDNLYSTGEIEKYEGMCVGIENGTSGMVISNPQVTYNGNATGEYEMATSAGATQTTLVMAGREYQGHISSPWVSLVADTFFYANQGVMEVDTVVTSVDMAIDTVIGMMHYAYSDYKILPRNNDDIVNLSENGTAIVLDTTNYQYPTSIVEVNGRRVETNVYPNPASDLISVSVNGVNNYVVTVFDLGGRLISETRVANNFTQISVSELNNGVYFVKVADQSGNQLAIEKIVIKH